MTLQRNLVGMDVKTIVEPLREEMIAVEEGLRSALSTRHKELEQSALHLLQSGGKRLRPFYLLLAGKLGQAPSECLREAAVAIELIHMATLIHDDVIDNAELRRNRLTVKARWDNQVAVYTGDFVLARALEVMCRIEQDSVHQILSKALVLLSQGEIEQIRQLYNVKQGILRYLQRIKRKTALLLAVSCQIGGELGTVSSAQSNALYRYGLQVGMAYQITDDILDLVGDPEQTGKAVGTDLRQGNYTLPILLSLRSLSAAERVFLQKELHSDELTDEGIGAIVRLVQRSGAIAEATRLSERYLRRAIEQLDFLAPSPFRDQLRDAALAIAGRTS